MTIDITVPELGESITEGIIARWLKDDGDFIQKSEPLFELESDKATQEVPSPAEGVLSIKVNEGETVEIGSVIGQIQEGKSKKKESPSKSEEKATPQEDDEEDSAPTPAARRLIREHDLSVEAIQGTGKAGRILKEDILKHLETKDETKENQETQPTPTKKPEPVPEPKVQEKREPMSSIRQRIAQRLVEAQQTAAILTTFNEVDLSAVMELRSQYKEEFEKKHGIKLGILSFFVKAVVQALQEFPIINARIDGEDIIYPQYQHIGIAVSTERGLMVPVLRHVEQLSFADIEKNIADLAQKGRDGKISVNDLQGGTFTITNGGVFGSLLSTPILNPPQSGILGMHTIQKRPVAINDEVVIRPMMYVALSYDHRIIDGRDAVRFLVRVKEGVEAPARLLLNV